MSGSASIVILSVKFMGYLADLFRYFVGLFAPYCFRLSYTSIFDYFSTCIMMFAQAAL